MFEQKKIGIVMSYFDRRVQLDNTLESIAKQRVNNVFVIVVDDGSSLPVDVFEKYPFDLEIIRVEPQDKKWTNSEVVLNKGIIRAIEKGAEIVILQNAECRHMGQIIEYTRENLTPFNYLSFACVATDKKGKFYQWYNHSVHRPVGYDFCAAITVDNLVELNGYDERFAFGIGYGDDHFLHRIKLKGLQVEIVDDPIVLHQWHPMNLPNQRMQLLQKNKNLFFGLKEKGEIRALKLLTKNLTYESSNHRG